jgi:hypothetical protein
MLAACLILVFCTVFSSTLKTEAIYSSGKLLDFHQTIWHHITEDRTFYISLTLTKCETCTKVMNLYKVMFTVLKIFFLQMQFLTRYGRFNRRNRSKEPENLNLSSWLYAGTFKFSFLLP